MKKYHFESVFRSLIYLFIALFLIALIVLCFYIDELHEGVIFVLTVLSVSVVAILFWFGFSLSMYIQIDYENKYLYVRQPYFIKKIKFEDIISIQIIPYSEVAFEFVVTTKKFTKKIPYARYLKRKPNVKIKNKLNDLKQDLMNISNKNYWKK